MLEKYKNIYFLGIGGIGMSSLALYFIDKQKSVGGYDKVKSSITNQLSSKGSIINYEDSKGNIPNNFLNKEETLVVYTPAIPKSNKQFVFFQQSSFKILKRSELLGIISKNKFCIAVAGTHGKTTTASILSHILLENNINFTSFIGGISENYNTNFIHNGDEIILVEADEFDRSFLTLYPDIACITSIDPDHLDVYFNEQSLHDSFTDFTNNVKNEGVLLVNEKISIKGSTFGFDKNSDFHITNYNVSNEEVFFDINYNGLISEIKFNMQGRHNALNALVAFAIGLELKIDKLKLSKSLSTFLGVKRRFTYVLKSPKIIIDDYAHHPKEIEEISKSIKELYPEKKVTAVFQPHLYSRTRDFMSEFADSLSLFDEVILTEIYPAREKPIKNINSKNLLNRIENNNKCLITKSNLP
ncbi:UDP-N-acetylmuramate--L-alanine ligase, partial [Flavobacteriaceae bacterium]|nr:UDP-N-acetylmuramate--L-alanine ligase [Flavobacteriaceae bacterium]